MLSNAVFIFNPISIGGGLYTVELYFQETTLAPYLNYGDIVKDTLGREYEVIAPTVIPNADGNTVTIGYINNNVLPQVDAGYDSTCFTPSQVELRPRVKTDGAIGSSVAYSLPNYEYTVSVSWNVSSEANKAEVGDLITDSSGKEFKLTFIDSVDRFDVPCRVAEVERVGIAPAVGDATMYRGTYNFGFFHGTPLSDVPRNNIRERDATIVDLNLKAGLETLKTMQSGHVAAIPANTPVSKLANGKIVPADSDLPVAKKFIGITKAIIYPNRTGPVFLVGPNLVGVLSAYSFAPGDEVYLSETGGGYTNDPNSFTGNNDEIIKVGIADCAAGNATATAPDLILFTEVVVSLL